MTVSVYTVQEVGFNDETLFCENLQTFGTRVPTSEMRVTWPSGRASDNSLQNRLFHSRAGYRMPRGPGTFEFDVPFCGALADTQTGALVATWLSTLLGDGLGGRDLTQVGGLAGASPTTTTMPNATGTRIRGGLAAVGIKGDARADGQGVVFTNPTTTLGNAMPVAPGATDVIRPCLMVWPSETMGATKRFMMGWNSGQNAGLQYGFHGCQLQNVIIKIVIGQLPMLTLQYKFAYWRELTAFTMPSATTLPDCKAAVSAAGMFHLQAVGTTTRNLEPASEITLQINFDLAEKPGQNGNFDLQSIMGFERVTSQKIAGTVTFSSPWSGTRPVEYDSDGSDSVFKQMYLTLSVGGGTAATEGRHVHLYAPNMYPIGQRPTVRNFNGLAYQDSQYGLAEGADVTNELTRSFLRIGMK